MVFLHFPSALTDEEILLKSKYAALRKKKAAVQAFQNPKSEPEKINTLKRTLEPKDAKEYAKKLILSGKITVPAKPVAAKATFKKPQGLLRKLNENRASATVNPTFNPDPLFQSTSGITGVSSGVQYKPFTPSPSSSSSPSSETGHGYSQTFTPDRKRRFRNNNNPNDDTGSTSFKKSPVKGKTVHVRGVGKLTDEMCREAFSNIGSIIRLYMESDRNCGFVTFDTIESAERAVEEINGTSIGTTKLQVSFAHRQIPVSEVLGDGSPAGLAWATIAANPSYKATFKDKRSAVVYDNDDF